MQLPIKHGGCFSRRLIEKKLPGIDVDQSGNIRAQGEDVQKVLVDGKEFFSNDPTVATKIYLLMLLKKCRYMINQVMNRNLPELKTDHKVKQ